MSTKEIWQRRNLKIKYDEFSKENLPQSVKELIKKTFEHPADEESMPTRKRLKAPKPAPKFNDKAQRQNILILLLMRKLLDHLFEKNPELKNAPEYKQLSDSIDEQLKSLKKELTPELKRFYDESKELVDTITPEELDHFFNMSKDEESPDRPLKKAPKTLQELFFEICFGITKTGERVVIQVAFAVAEMITPQSANQETSLAPLFLLTHSLNGLVKNPEIRERNKERLEQLEQFEETPTAAEQPPAPTPFPDPKLGPPPPTDF